MWLLTHFHGLIPPFAVTMGGIGEAYFAAPPVFGTHSTISGEDGGVKLSDLAASPVSWTISGEAGGLK